MEENRRRVQLSSGYYHSLYVLQHGGGTQRIFCVQIIYFFPFSLFHIFHFLIAKCYKRKIYEPLQFLTYFTKKRYVQQQWPISPGLCF